MKHLELMRTKKSMSKHLGLDIRTFSKRGLLKDFVDVVKGDKRIGYVYIDDMKNIVLDFLISKEGEDESGGGSEVDVKEG